MKARSRFASGYATAAHEAEKDRIDLAGCVVGTTAVQILSQRIPADNAPPTAVVQTFAALPEHLP